MLARWTQGDRVQEAILGNKAALFRNLTLKPEEMPIMSTSEVRKLQRNHLLGKWLKIDAAGIGRFVRKFWIPVKKERRYLKTFLNSHCRIGGYRRHNVKPCVL